MVEGAGGRGRELSGDVEVVGWRVVDCLGLRWGGLGGSDGFADGDGDGAGAYVWTRDRARLVCRDHLCGSRHCGSTALRDIRGLFVASGGGIGAD